jgi:hypothetical protein
MMVIKGRPFMIIRDWIGRGFSSIDQDRIFLRRELTVFLKAFGQAVSSYAGVGVLYIAQPKKALLQGSALTFRR